MATKWVAVNGSKHGKDITGPELKDGDITHVDVVGPLHSHGEDEDIRFTHPKFKQTYWLWGKYAYYVGEELIKKEF